MKKNLSIMTALVLALIVSSCAHNKSAAEQKIENEIKEVPASQAKSLEKTIKEQIAASTLSEDQKTKLAALDAKAHAEHTAITEEIEKTKVVMVQTVLSPKMDQQEFSILRKKIVDLDKKRMENGFKTLREIRKIINPQAANTQDREVYKAVIENRLRGF